MGDAQADPEAATGEIERWLSAAHPRAVYRFSQMLERLADHMARRIEYAESRRGNMAAVGGALLGAGVASLAVVRAFRTPIEFGLGALAGALILVSSAVLIVYARQTNPKYGFIQPQTRFQRPWKWFYRDALPDAASFTFPIHTLQTRTKAQEGIDAFDEQWPQFARRYVDLINVRTDAVQNLRQVYLLHVNERYKNLFLTQLRKVLVRGLIGAVLIGATTWIVALMIEVRRDEKEDPGLRGPRPRISAPAPEPTITVVSPNTGPTSPLLLTDRQAR
jgi:hypothetical protein